MKYKSLIYLFIYLAYDNSHTGETFIVVVHQAIYVPHMQHNLLSCMQLRLNDVIVNEVPKFLTEKSYCHYSQHHDPRFNSRPRRHSLDPVNDQWCNLDVSETQA